MFSNCYVRFLKVLITKHDDSYGIIRSQSNTFRELPTHSLFNTTGLGRIVDGTAESKTMETMREGSAWRRSGQAHALSYCFVFL